MIVPERHLANTRSKKKICLYDTDDLEFIHEKTKDQNIQDRFDCLCVFEYESLVALRLIDEFSEEYRRMHSMYLFNLYFFEDETLAKEMTSLGLVTSIDRSVYGHSLLKHFLQK